MPREIQQRLVGRQTPDYNPNPVFTQVNANPVDTTVAPVTNNAMRLAAALGQIQPELNSMMATQVQQENTKFDHERRQEGINDGLTGVDPRHPDNQTYMEQWQHSRTQKGVADVTREWEQFRLENRHNPNVDFEAKLASLTDKLKGTSPLVYNSVVNQTGSLLAPANSKEAELADQANATLGGQDALMGKTPQSNDFSYSQKYIEQLGKITAAKVSQEFALQFEQNKENPNFDPAAEFKGIADKYLAGVDNAVIKGAVLIEGFNEINKAKLIHQKNMAEQQQKRMLDSAEAGIASVFSASNKSPTEMLKDINGQRESLTGGLTPALTKAQFDEKQFAFMKADSINPANRRKHLAVLELPNKDGVRLMDTIKGRELHSDISKAEKADEDKKIQEEIGKANAKLMVVMHEQLAKDPSSISQASLTKQLDNGSITPAQYQQLSETRIKAQQDAAEVAYYLNQAEGPNAIFYTQQDPKGKKIFQEQGLKAYQRVSETLTGFDMEISKAEAAGDGARVATLKQEVKNLLAPIFSKAVNDANSGRVASPVLGHFLESALLNPFDDKGQLKNSFMAAFDVVVGSEQNPGIIAANPALTKYFPEGARDAVLFMRRLQEDFKYLPKNEDKAVAVKRILDESRDPAKMKEAASYTGSASDFGGMRDAVKNFQKEQGLKEFPADFNDQAQREFVAIMRKNPGYPVQSAKDAAIQATVANHIVYNKNAVRILPGMNSQQMTDFMEYQRQTLSDQGQGDLERLDVGSGENPFVTWVVVRDGVRIPLKQQRMNDVLTDYDKAFTASPEADKAQFDAINALVDAGKKAGYIPSGTVITPTAEGLQNFWELRDTYITAERERILKLPVAQRMAELERLQALEPHSDSGKVGALLDATTMPIRAKAEKYASRFFGGVGELASTINDFGKKTLGKQPTPVPLWVVTALGGDILKAQNAKLAGDVQKSIVSSQLDLLKLRDETQKPAYPVAGTASLSIDNTSPAHATKQKQQSALARLESRIGNPAVSSKFNNQLVYTGSIESVSLTAYQDQGKGGVAIGWGYNVKQQKEKTAEDHFKRAGIDLGILKGMRAGSTNVKALTEDQADMLFQVYCEDSDKEIMAKVGEKQWNKLSPAQQTVLRDDAYNMGVPNASKNTAWLALARGDSQAYLRLRAEQRVGPEPGLATNKERRLTAAQLMLSSSSSDEGLRRVLSARSGKKYQQQK